MRLFEVLVWCGASGNVVICNTFLMGFNNAIYPFQSHDRGRMTRRRSGIYLYHKWFTSCNEVQSIGNETSAKDEDIILTWYTMATLFGLAYTIMSWQKVRVRGDRGVRSSLHLTRHRVRGAKSAIGHVLGTCKKLSDNISVPWTSMRYNHAADYAAQSGT